VTTLERRLGLPSAIAIGLSSMIGAGVFFVWAPAAAVAGSGLLIGLALAAVVAILNALSTTQLAMANPVSGGSYSYARATIGERTGFAAGLLFLVGKTASVAAIALIAGGYLWPEHTRLVAVGVLALFAAVNMTGIRSTATTSTIIVAIVVVGLVAVLAVSVAGGDPQPIRVDVEAGWYGILQSAGLLFFCFAGYARVATLGEEVRDPRHTLPRAIIVALAITLVVYTAVAVVCLSLLGPVLATTASPLAALAGGAADPVVRVVAGIACLGSLMGILAALSRTALAMGRGGDLPGVLSMVNARTHSPVVAEAVVAMIAILAVLFLAPERLVGVSACAVLAYYAIAHASALRQPPEQRWLPRMIQVAGLVGCTLLAVTLPWQAIAATAGVVALGLLARTLALRTVRA
jgi:APA family basic amino acid/polyamine antiporter